MNFYEKLQSLDRRYIYLIVALAIIIPLLIPYNSKTYVTEPTENVYRMIDSFSGRPDKAILLCYSHDASTTAELLPMEVAILRHCFERNIKVFTLTFLEAASPLVDYSINIAKEDFPEVVSGVDYVNFGFKPYSLFLPILLGMGEDIAEAVDTDSEGRKIENLPIMQDIKNYNDMNLVMDFSASGSVFSWITYARVKFGANVAAGITAVMAADNYPYLQSGQLIGMLSGLKGAAEYEALVDLFAAYSNGDYPNGRPLSRELHREIIIPLNTDYVTYIYEENNEKKEVVTDVKLDYKFKTARIGMNAQSVAHIMIIVFILIGNVGYFMSKKKTGR
ncbi:MAG: hypothetical protein PHR06_01515 [Candidatus Cloacimonetes bacterium]|nr:hypothetical protein [Candidatus Cloacimonadota bacterium]